VVLVHVPVSQSINEYRAWQFNNAVATLRGYRKGLRVGLWEQRAHIDVANCHGPTGKRRLTSVNREPWLCPACLKVAIRNQVLREVGLRFNHSREQRGRGHDRSHVKRPASAVTTARISGGTISIMPTFTRALSALCCECSVFTLLCCLCVGQSSNTYDDKT
jgi:hypothetical protein